MDPISDISGIYTEGRRQRLLESNDVERIIEAYHKETGVSRTVSMGEIAGQEYILNPKRYIGLNLVADNAVPLRDLVKDIRRGSMMRSTKLEKLHTNEVTFYSYLMLQDIADGSLADNLQNLTMIEDRYLKHCVRNNDLVVSKLSPFKVALARVDANQTVLANANLYLLEIDEEKVNHIFIEVFLQSEAGMAQLNRLAKGGVMKSISIQDLKTVQIPALSRHDQDRLADEHLALREDLKALLGQVEHVRAKMG